MSIKQQLCTQGAGYCTHNMCKSTHNMEKIHMKIQIDFDNDALIVDGNGMHINSPKEILRILIEVLNAIDSRGVILEKIDEGITTTIDEW